jgi:hypothetical protein
MSNDISKPSVKVVMPRSDCADIPGTGRELNCPRWFDGLPCAQIRKEPA